MTTKVPDYDDLPFHEELQMRSSWGVFGEDDQVGTLNFITEECVKAASSEIRTGKVFNLSLPLNLPDPAIFRQNYKHVIYRTSRNSQDDYIDNFYMQNSSQWDSLRHIQAREFGFYNGVSEQDAGPEGDKLGIDRYVEKGIVGRGVLIDVQGYFARKGEHYDARKETFLGPDLLDDILADQGTETRPGDILMLRTGYVRAYLDASPEERVQFKEHRDCAGLTASEPTARYLWNKRFSAVCSDNPAVEVIPGRSEDGFLHRRLIPMLGFALGELFDYEALAEACAATGQYTCFFTGVPLYVPGGVGSPANAIAIK
jgi:kynurenine formamidase